MSYQPFGYFLRATSNKTRWDCRFWLRLPTAIFRHACYTRARLICNLFGKAKWVFVIFSHSAVFRQLSHPPKIVFCLRIIASARAYYTVLPKYETRYEYRFGQRTCIRNTNNDVNGVCGVRPVFWREEKKKTTYSTSPHWQRNIHNLSRRKMQVLRWDYLWWNTPKSSAYFRPP